jgi:hypothetical protein
MVPPITFFAIKGPAISFAAIAFLIRRGFNKKPSDTEAAATRRRTANCNNN